MLEFIKIFIVYTQRKRPTFSRSNTIDSNVSVVSSISLLEYSTGDFSIGVVANVRERKSCDIS